MDVAGRSGQTTRNRIPYDFWAKGFIQEKPLRHFGAENRNIVLDTLSVNRRLYCEL